MALAIVMASAVLVEYLFGSRRPAEELQSEMEKRLALLARFYRLLAEVPATRDTEQLRTLQHQMVAYAHAGELRLNQLYERVRDASPMMAKVPLGLHYRIGLLARVLEKSAIIGFDSVLQHDRFSQEYYTAIANQCERHRIGAGYCLGTCQTQ